MQNSQDLNKMPPRFGYRRSLSDGKKLSDNPSGGGSGDTNNNDNED